MNAVASYGMVFGLMIGLVIAVILLKFANKDHRFKTQYDERQESIKGRGYKYSFYTLACLEAALAILEVGDISFGIERYLVHFIVLLISFAVLCVHSIWNGTYWGLNNNRKRYIIVFAVCAALNMIPLIGLFRGEGLTADGKLGAPIVNIMVLIMMAILAIELIIKEALDRREKEED